MLASILLFHSSWMTWVRFHTYTVSYRIPVIMSHNFVFLVNVIPDPVTLTTFAYSLKTTRDPGVLYRRFTGHVASLETMHLVGPEVGYDEETAIRHIVSVFIFFQF